MSSDLSITNKKFDPATYLVKDCFQQILLRLDINSLIKSFQVSKTWNEIANKNIIWKQIATSFGLTIPKGENIREYLNSIKTPNDLEKFVKEHIAKIQPGSSTYFLAKNIFEPKVYYSLKICGKNYVERPTKIVPFLFKSDPKKLRNNESGAFIYGSNVLGIRSRNPVYKQINYSWPKSTFLDKNMESDLIQNRINQIWLNSYQEFFKTIMIALILVLLNQTV